MEIAMAAFSSDIVVECSPGLQLKSRKEAVSEMGLLSTETKSQDFVTIDMPLEQVSIFNSPSAVYDVSSRGNPNSEYQTGTLNMEEVAILAFGNSPFERPMVAVNRSTSLPANLSPAKIPNGNREYLPIYRSRSVPLSYTDVTMSDDHVSMLHVVPNRRSNERISGILSPVMAILYGAGNQDTITEEEAVCRICYERLGEQHTFRMDCNCRGQLALVHRDCCQRWFNIRGTSTCEVCNCSVRNVTVRISRRITRRVSTSILDHFEHPPVTYHDILWHRFMILIMYSMMAYVVSITFIMLRRLKENTAELYGSVSAVLVLSIFTSVAAAAFVEWKDVWIYALAQYVVFTVFAVFFFDLCHLGPLPTIILSAFFAVGIGRGAEPAYNAIKKCIETRLNEVNNNAQDVALPIEILPTVETNESHQSSDANNHESSYEADESLQSGSKHREFSDETDESLPSDANCHDSTE